MIFGHALNGREHSNICLFVCDAMVGVYGMHGKLQLGLE